MKQTIISIDHQKKEIELSLARTILTQLEKNEIDPDVSQAIARFILNNIDEITNQKQMQDFLQQLAQKWPIFEGVAHLYQLKAKEEQETQVKLEAAQTKLSQFIQ